MLDVTSSKASNIDLGSLRGRLTRATGQFSQHLATQRSACLAQIWVPTEHQNDSITLHTQGVPFCVAGCADLLALFRCVSCRYKFGTDPTKPGLMGAVGRCFVTGQPEMLHNVQQYDKQHFLRVDEAQRCRVQSAMFMPLYTSAHGQRPFGVFEVVQAETDAMFPLLMLLLKRCLQEVQLYTADPEQHMAHMGLRNPPITLPSPTDPQNKDHVRAESDGPQQGTQHCHQTRTHCSANSLQAQGHLQGIAGRPATAVATAKQGGKMREASADSEEVKRGTSSERSGGSVGGSPHSRSPGSLGPCRLSTTQRQLSGDLQTGSGGSTVSPRVGAVSSCPPAHLVAVGKTLQLQTSAAPGPPPTALLSPDKSASASSTAMGAAVPVISPFEQQQHHQHQQTHHQQQQQQQQVQQQVQQQHHHMQFLANALQLQSQLTAHTQMRPGTPAPVGSAFAGLQEPFSPRGVALPAAALLPLQRSLEEEEGEQHPADGDEEQQINNRTAGGAGKRLSVEDLQSQFGFGLREAAHNLRICPTTLKRACRRHGIHRWPRRQGSAGDPSRQESLNLDTDSVTSLGGPDGDQPAVTAAATGAAGLPLGLASAASCPVGVQGGPGGAALEGFRALDSAGQLALLQSLAAAKADTSNGQWLQGTHLNAALKVSALPRASTAAPTSAVQLLNSPAQQLGSGLMVSMLASQSASMSQMAAQATASQPSMPQLSFAKAQGILPQQGVSMARQLSAPVPGQHAQQAQHAQQQPQGFERQHALGNAAVVRQGSAGQGCVQQPHGQGQFLGHDQSLHLHGQLQVQPQGSTQQPQLPGQLPAGLLHQISLSQGIAHQPNLSGQYMTSGLPQQLWPMPRNSNSSTGSSRCFTAACAPQPGMTHPTSMTNTAGMTHPAGVTHSAGMLNSACSAQQPGMTRPPASMTHQAGMTTPWQQQQLSQLSLALTSSAANARQQAPQSQLQQQQQQQQPMVCKVNDEDFSLHEASYPELGLEPMQCMPSPAEVPLDSGSGQNSEAMQFDAADHGFGPLDLLVDGDLDLDHQEDLGFDPADCLV